MAFHQWVQCPSGEKGSLTSVNATCHGWVRWIQVESSSAARRQVLAKLVI
jgi:hypothetical protein